MNNPELNICMDEPKWQSALPDAVQLAAKTAQKVLTVVRGENLDILAGTKPLQVNLSLSNDAEISELNKRFRGLDRPTNVLSFANLDDPDFAAELSRSEMVELGDIMVALETLQRESEEQAIPLADHFCHLFAHGLLHLLGYDHQNDEETGQMEALEITVLESLNINNPYQEK